jgi:hypothetical protein
MLKGEVSKNASANWIEVDDVAMLTQIFCFVTSHPFVREEPVL